MSAMVNKPTLRLAHRGLRLAIGLLTMGAVLTMATVPASAKQTRLPEESFGSAAKPTFASANSIAVDTTRNSVLVIDSQAKTVSRFKADGSPDAFSALGSNVIDAKGGSSCASVPADCDRTPQNGFTFGAFGGEEQVAVDTSGTGTDGNIYVTQADQSAGNLVDIFGGDGKYLGQLTAAGTEGFGATGFPFSPCGVAVDGEGHVYLGGGYDQKIYKFTSTGNPPTNGDISGIFNTSDPVCSLAAGVGPTAGWLFVNSFAAFKGSSLRKVNATTGIPGYALDSREYRLVSVDPANGHVLAFTRDDGGPGESEEIREFDASGASATLLSATSAGGVTGLAGNGPKLYTANPNFSGPKPLTVYGPVVTLPDVTTESTTITGNTSATLEGTVDPDGTPLEECKFEYGLTTAYEESASCTESVGEIGTTSKAVHAEVSGLAPESLYHYRLTAKNSNGTVNGGDETFKSPSKPAIVSLGSIKVGRDGATLISRINSENSPTTYRFELGVDTTYGTGSAVGEVGIDATEHTVSDKFQGLEAGKTYHYRVIATNGIGVTTSIDHTFITFPPVHPVDSSCPNAIFRVSLSASLPNCRAYEMVSPVDKNGGDIKVLVQGASFPARLDQSSDNGNAFTYSSVAAFSEPQSAPWSSQYLARRGAAGWVNQPINSPRESVSIENNPSLNLDVPYHLFSADLSEGWMYQGANPPLDACAPEGLINLYRRDNLTGAYEALVASTPPSLSTEEGYRLELQGVSTDGSHSVFRANAKLTSDAASGGYQLYEHVRGEGCGTLRLVSQLPNGKASTQPATLHASAGSPLGPGEYRESTVARAVSRDGTRVVFRLAVSPTAAGPLYIRINADQEQSVVSAGKCTEASKGCTLQIAPGDARFWSASADGSRVIYSVGSNEFFEYDLQKALAGNPASTLIAASAVGIAAASEDTSRIYLVSTEQLGGLGVGGEPNLFSYEPGKSGAARYGLVATLGEGDLHAFRSLGFSIAHLPPIPNGVRVTPDGAHLAFVSTANLTGYDNTDAADGLPDLELYLYDLDTGKLACVSCNPSGSQPEGRKFDELGITRRVSAQMAPGESQSFAPRALSEDGNRLFFESFEPLLPGDVNKAEDVYEWERASSQAGCEEIGAELYVPNAGGCLSLISSGKDESDSELADASPDGADVFIRTGANLLPQDHGQVDVYDAREGGGFPIHVDLEPCSGEICQGPAPAPPLDPTPATRGPSTGNVTPGKPKHCPKGKVRRKGKCVKPGKHKPKAKGHKRAANNNGGGGQ
jgi:hypothetical protein